MDIATLTPGPGMMNAPVSMGTTLFAMEFEGGVLLGADSRTSSGTFIANRVTDKLTQIYDNIFVCRSGSAADTQAIADMVKYRLDFHAVVHGRKPRVLEAAKMAQYICYNYRDDLSAGLIVAGWDEVDGGQVYSIPLGGMLVRQKAVLGGSGSTFLYGYFDKMYSPDFKKEEAVQFVLDCVALAISRDGSSGGVVRVATLNKDGVERFLYTGAEVPVYMGRY
ncbi:Proteasome subunit beta type-6 [Cichlidogyrus casuarinus]|uniref:Proteasome subunit beta n=1 Tax=Cichlidogyrus casuarinus TaxID=1844966 RepID=A0ABD2QAT1_9PLAT